jgi:glycosyltransferase involved in cell wall biosynthesis
VRILLLGEYSRLHNSLKEGLVALGHDVVLVGNGDGFKDYPVDFSIEAKWSKTKLINIIRQIIAKIFKYDFAKLEHGIRFYFLLSKLKGFDIVQLINESPVQTNQRFELFLLKKIVQQNKNIFLLCCGIDYAVVQHMLLKKERYSIMNPYFEGNKEAKKEIDFILSYNTKNHYKIHQFIYENCKGIIASDIDYVNPIKDHKKYLGLIPNPINWEKISYIENTITNKIIIFLGINTFNYYTKGIVFFEKALAIIKEKYADKVDIIVTKNIAYNKYIKLYDKAHILLDQVYAFDQGYNALEAMAKGKVVFTGAESAFENYYNITEKVAINALPDVNYLVDELSFLIENPHEIEVIGKNASIFIEKEHNYKAIAKQYFEKWMAGIHK